MSVYGDASDTLLARAAHCLGATRVNRAGGMLEVVQVVLAVVIWLGKFLQVR